MPGNLETLDRAPQEKREIALEDALANAPGLAAIIRAEHGEYARLEHRMYSADKSLFDVVLPGTEGRVGFVFMEFDEYGDLKTVVYNGNTVLSREQKGPVKIV